MILPKAVSCPILSVLDLQNTGLVHCSGKNAGARNLFHWHGFTSDVGLVHERMSADNHPVHGDVSPWPDQHYVADVDTRYAPRSHLTIATALPRLAAANPAVA